jgi:hypothetical protein
MHKGSFLKSCAVRGLKCLYKKALGIEYGSSKGEHAFFLHLLKMNPDMAGALTLRGRRDLRIG